MAPAPPVRTKLREIVEVVVNASCWVVMAILMAELTCVGAGFYWIGI